MSIGNKHYIVFDEKTGKMHSEFRHEDGEAFDIFPQGQGDFGTTVSNPIPTCGITGSQEYLRQLKTENGKEIAAKRIGSTRADNIEGIIDKYEIYDKGTGERLCELYLCPYSKKTSALAPKGFVLTATGKSVKDNTSDTTSKPANDTSNSTPLEHKADTGKIVLGGVCGIFLLVGAWLALWAFSPTNPELPRQAEREDIANLNSLELPELVRLAELGDAKAQFSLAMDFFRGNPPKDPIKGAEWLRKSAEQGYADAQAYLGEAYHSWKSSIAGLPNDDFIAVYWWRKAADQGNAKAQYHLSHAYDVGLGAPKDKIKRMELLMKSANQGYIRAQLNLGLVYNQGQDGVPQDYTKAAQWYQKAADQGDASAQLFLGRMYLDGEGVNRDRQKGCSLLRASAEQGDRVAIKEFNELCAN